MCLSWGGIDLARYWVVSCKLYGTGCTTELHELSNRERRGRLPLAACDPRDSRAVMVPSLDNDQALIIRGWGFEDDAFGAGF